VTQTTRRWRIEPVRAAIVATALVVAVAVFFGLQFYQNQHGRSALLAEAEKLVRDKKPELALHYLNEYLDRNPEDAAALDMKAGLLADSARAYPHLVEAIKASEQALRADPDRREIQRRLLELHLKLGDLAPEAGRYQTAEAIVQQVTTDADKKGTPLEAVDWRLAARVQEGLAVLAADNAAALDQAIRRYERARQLDRKDVVSAERLARLYGRRRNDPQKAVAVLDDLARANPSAEALLARYRYFSSEASAEADPVRARAAEARAAEALKQAVAKAPDDYEARMAAAEDALRHGDSAAARGHLDRLPESAREDHRVRFVRGMAELQDNHADEAIASWRQGLLASNGGDAEMTWRLAYVLLQLGRVAEAEPLMAQFRRLSGGDEPSPAWRLLHAVKELKQNNPANAIGELEAARLKINPLLSNQLYFTLGNCYEAIRDESRAMEVYRRAIKAAPKWAAPRLALIRLLQPRQPDVAVAELNTALVEIPDDPVLTVLKARSELRKLLQDRRTGKADPKSKAAAKELDQALQQARRAGRSGAGVVLVEADYLAESGQLDQAVTRLEEGVRRDKTDADLWVALARRLVQAGRDEAALKALEQASAPDAAGSMAAVRILRAELLTRLGHGKEGRELLVRDVELLRPDQRPLVWMKLGDLYSAQSGKEAREQALKAYAEWARLLPDDPVPRLFLLEQALADRDEPKIRAGIEALKGKGTVQNLYYRVAQALELLARNDPKESAADRDRRFAQVQELIDTIRGEAPEQRFAYMLQGQLLERQNKFQEAASAYEQAMEHEGGPIVLQRLVVLYTKLDNKAKLDQMRRAQPDVAPGLARYQAEMALRVGNKDQANRLADLVAQADPDNVDAQVWYARMLNSLDNPQKAEQALRDLVAKRPEEPGPYLALLYFQVSRKQMAAARETAAKVRASVTKTARPEFLYAQCYRTAGDLPAAEAMYKEALRKWPDETRIARGVSDFYETINRPEESLKLLEAFSARRPEERWAVRARALLLSARTNDPTAWARAWELIGSGQAGDAPEDRLARGIVLARGPKPQQRREAVDVLERLVEDLPADLMTTAAARNFLVRLYLKEDRPERAAELAAVEGLAAAAAPTAIALHVEALLRTKQWDLAERQIRRLDAMLPDDPTAQRLRVRYLTARGKPAEAAAVLEKLFAAHRDAADGEAVGREVTASLFELGQVDAAERVARAMVEKWPDRTKAVLGTVLAGQGKRREAMDLYQAAAASKDTALVREAVQNAVALATSDRDAALMDRAYAILDVALKREPNSADLLTKKGYLCHFQGKYEDEVNLYRDALGRNPGDFRFLNNMAWTLSEGLHRPDEALERVNEAFRRAGGARYYQFYDTRGVIYTRLGKFDEAIRDLEDAVQINPAPTVYAHLANAYHKAGRAEQFRKARDAAKKAGLTPDRLEATERQELEKLLFAGT
jgi:tetratricopeptide (TPR) repeat protein